MVGYNEAKEEVLEVLSRMNANAWDIALITNRSHECACTLLRNYHLMGLLSRRKIGRNYVYIITEKGLARLNWLKGEID